MEDYRMKKMIQKSVTAIVLAVTILPMIYLGGYYLDGMILLLMSVLCYEVSRIRKFPWQNLIMVLMFIAVVGLFFCKPENLIFYLGCSAIVIFTIPIINTNFKLVDILTLFILLFMATMAIIGMRNLRAYSLPLTIVVLAATLSTDTFAYFVGSFLGKRKLAPTISPNKTLEGAIAGWIGGGLIVIACRYLFCPDLPVNLMILLAVFMPIISQIGDLAFSFIKREYGIKDYGSVFGGQHGGVFDRIDSVIFALIFINYLLHVVVK